MPAAPRPIPLSLDSYLDQQKRAEAAYPIPTIVSRIKVSVPDPVELWIRGGGSGGAATGTVPNTPPKSTDTKYRGIKIPTVAGSEGGFWGLISGLAALTFGCALLLWWFLRRRKAHRNNPQGSNTSTTSTHNSFTSLASLFRRPFSRRSNNAPPLDSTTASKRGWLHGSARDWNEIEEDENDLVRGRPGESMELYNQISKSNPDPVGTMERRGSRSPLPGDSPMFTPAAGGSHPYGQGGSATSTNSLGNFASTSTIRLTSPSGDGGREYRDQSPFDEGGSESGYFTPSGETREEEQGKGLRPGLERPLSGKFREDDDHSVDSRSRR